MCGYFCIGFIDVMLAGKKTDWFYEFAFSSWLWENDEIILSYFKDKWNWQNKLDRSDKIWIRWNK